MGLFNQNGDNEKEMSGGAMFGYVLVGFIVVVVLVFGIFAATTAISKHNKDNSKQDTQIEQTVNTEIQN